MQRKHNPFVSLAALILLAVILVLACAGCSEPAAAAEPETPERFTIEQQSRYAMHGDTAYIVTDNQTGVQYLYIRGTNAGGLTVLQDGEG